MKFFKIFHTLRYEYLGTVRALTPVRACQKAADEFNIRVTAIHAEAV